MKMPATVDAKWIATLANEQLVEVEATLHAEFNKQEIREKKRAGARYEMLRGPEPLVNAWLRWLMVNNETQKRGMVVNRRSRT